MKQLKRVLCLTLMLAMAFTAFSASAAVYEIGSKGKMVTQLQTRLRDLGYFREEIDGVFGFQLYSAVWSYQKDNGLKVDGIAGNETLASLGLIASTGKTSSAANGLDYGASGTAVVALQNALNAAGYKVPVDGQYGFQTYSALWQYQHAKGLPVTGVADTKTLSMLGVTATSSTVSRNVKYGKSNTDTAAVQRALADKGFYHDAIDGKFGWNTYVALWDFQKANGLMVTGEADAQTIQKLGISGSAPAAGKLDYGSKGQAVRDLQNALKKLGYYKADVDGVYGYATYEAVWSFQHKNGLVVDGVAGSTTLSLLYSGKAK